MYLFADTETDGLWKYGFGERDPRQPRAIQVAAAAYDATGRELWAFTSVLRPLEGQPAMSAESVAVHGITEEARKLGADPRRFYHALIGMINDTTPRILGGHNPGFDVRVLRRCLLELGADGSADFIGGLPTHDTMRSSIELCKLPKKDGRPGYKRPNLGELYRFLFERELNGAHDALIDVRASAECYFEMLHRGVTMLEAELPPITGGIEPDVIKGVLDKVTVKAPKNAKEADFIREQLEKFARDRDSYAPSEGVWKWLKDIATRP